MQKCTEMLLYGAEISQCHSLGWICDSPFCISQIEYYNKIQFFFSLKASLLHSVLLLFASRAETVEVIYMQSAPYIVYTNYIIRSNNENFLACLGHLSMR